MQHEIENMGKIEAWRAISANCPNVSLENQKERRIKKLSSKGWPFELRDINYFGIQPDDGFQHETSLLALFHQYFIVGTIHFKHIGSWLQCTIHRVVSGMKVLLKNFLT